MGQRNSSPAASLRPGPCKVLDCEWSRWMRTCRRVPQVSFPPGILCIWAWINLVLSLWLLFIWQY